MVELSWKIGNSSKYADENTEKNVKLKLRKETGWNCPECGKRKWFYHIPDEVIEQDSDGTHICTKCKESFLIVNSGDALRCLEWEEKDGND